MSSYDIAEAMAYERLYPDNQSRADYRAGLMASVVANVNRGQGQKPFKPSDFMADWGKKPKKKTVKTQLMEVFGIGKPSDSGR